MGAVLDQGIEYLLSSGIFASRNIEIRAFSRCRPTWVR
jgi:hypothetical protein